MVLGFKTLQDYVKFVSPPVIANGGPYFGETIGRYGNRIAKGTFKLNGKTYTLPINNGVNSPARRAGRLRQPHLGVPRRSTARGPQACSSRWSARTATRAGPRDPSAARTAAPGTRPS